MKMPLKEALRNTRYPNETHVSNVKDGPVDLKNVTFKKWRDGRYFFTIGYPAFFS